MNNIQPANIVCTELPIIDVIINIDNINIAINNIFIIFFIFNFPFYDLNVS